MQQRYIRILYILDHKDEPVTGAPQQKGAQFMEKKIEKHIAQRFGLERQHIHKQCFLPLTLPLPHPVLFFFFYSSTALFSVECLAEKVERPLNGGLDGRKGGELPGICNTTVPIRYIGCPFIRGRTNIGNEHLVVHSTHSL